MVTFSKDKTFTLRGKVKLSGSIPIKYFVRGDSIPITINVDNESSKGVKRISVVLMRNFIVSVRDNDSYEEKTFSEEVSEWIHNDVQLKKKQSVRGIQMKYPIPNGIVPSFRGEIFSVTYDVCISFFVLIYFCCEIYFFL